MNSIPRRVASPGGTPNRIKSFVFMCFSILTPPRCPFPLRFYRVILGCVQESARLGAGTARPIKMLVYHKTRGRGRPAPFLNASCEAAGPVDCSRIDHGSPGSFPGRPIHRSASVSPFRNNFHCVSAKRNSDTQDLETFVPKFVGGSCWKPWQRTC